MEERFQDFNRAARDKKIEQLFKHRLNEAFKHKQKADLILFVLPKVDISLYNQIKHIADVPFGIQTICSVFEKFTRQKGDGFDLGLLANITLKANVKTGRINHIVNSKRLGVVGQGKTMVAGLDVTHPSPRSKENAPSILGFVCSTDGTCTNFPGMIRLQPRFQEKADHLVDLFMLRLGIWKEMHGNLPENILLYRDGVSEGQYQMVVDEELPQIQHACKPLYGRTLAEKGIPRITIVVVGKRHHVSSCSK